MVAQGLEFPHTKNLSKIVLESPSSEAPNRELCKVGKIAIFEKELGNTVGSRHTILGNANMKSYVIYITVMLCVILSNSLDLVHAFDDHQNISDKNLHAAGTVHLLASRNVGSFATQ